jgi:hypothetical protein
MTQFDSEWSRRGRQRRGRRYILAWLNTWIAKITSLIISIGIDISFTILIVLALKTLE